MNAAGDGGTGAQPGAEVSDGGAAAGAARQGAGGGATAVGGRRRALVAGVALAAAAAGGGFAWWRGRGGDDGPAGGEALWPLALVDPAGAPLPLAAFRGRPLLVNFWATWCPPCVEELPMLDAFHRRQGATGMQVLGLAVDQPSAVRRFLERTPVSFPVAMAGLEGTDLSKRMGNLSGGLPFTVVLAQDGQVRQRRMGRLSEADLAQWASAGQADQKN